MVLEQIFEMFLPFIPVGFLLGCLPMLAGIGIHGVINIIKKI